MQPNRPQPPPLAALPDLSGRAVAGRLAVLLGVMTLLRMGAAVSFPMLASETYYWLWGQFPALGYYDHPPMVGWVGTLLFGWVEGSPLAARSGPIVLGALTTLVIYGLTAELFASRRTGWRAALLFGIVPIFNVGCMVIQPDNALMLFTALTWWLFWRAAQRGADRLPWLLAGVTAGLALLSKFHAWALLPPLYLFLLLWPPHRRLLRTPGPWLAIAVALAVLSPNLIWNAQHGWLTYGFQSSRSGLADPEPGVKHLLEYLAGPLATLSPPVYFAMLAATWRTAARWRQLRPETLFLLLAGAPILLFFLAISPLVSVSLHWPAVGYIPLVILAVGLNARGELGGARLRRAMIGTCVAMLVLLQSVPWIVRLLPEHLALPFHRSEINTARLKAELTDWPAIGRAVRERYEQAPQRANTVVMTPDFHLAAQLSFYAELPGRLRVLVENRKHSFELWEARPGQPAVRNAIILLPCKFRDLADLRTEEKTQKLLKRIDALFERRQWGPQIVSAGDGGPPEENQRCFQIIDAFDYRGEDGPRPAPAP